MVDVMKGVKWAVGWKDKQNMAAAPPLTPEELQERLLMKQQQRERIQFTPKRGEPIEPTVYPLSPVAKPKKIKRLPSYLKKTNYRKGRVN